MEVRGWRDGGPRGADGPRGRWADPRPAPGRVGADGLGPAPAGDGQLRVSPRAAGGRAVFHFFPQSALNYKSGTSKESHGPALGSPPRTGAFPQKQPWSLAKSSTKQPHPKYFGGGGGGGRGKSWIFGVSKECSVHGVEPRDSAGIPPDSTYGAGRFMWPNRRLFRCHRAWSKRGSRGNPDPLGSWGLHRASSGSFGHIGHATNIGGMDEPVKEYSTMHRKSLYSFLPSSQQRPRLLKARHPSSSDVSFASFLLQLKNKTKPQQKDHSAFQKT